MMIGNLIDKKSICHALISSSISPDVMIPVKGVVEDVHFGDGIPHYDIKIIKFYDGIDFLRKNLEGKTFLLKYKGKVKPLSIPSEIKTANELEIWFSEKSTYRFCVESAFVVKTKAEMVDLFNKIQEYLIIQNLRSIRTTIMRPLFDGPFRTLSKVEFKERLRRMIGDKFEESEFDRLNDSI